ncbi:hypothetical protein FN976_23010 [Caenimonas sedimenti]|uniref:Uncharacterized protein n=1 Tax=Caenimonas sedimenti TaxID=2596921 RepID=A0A562ZJZ1_9BURK|nr:hypothetical protein [Caenimonas sedimenti]TWO68504.1 hypothetical protein FN976_23010 [Caenimonas sedimenti]
MSDLAQTRRRNLVHLHKEFMQGMLAGGAPPKGLEMAFAQQLQISASMLSQIKSSRPIGDKLARQVETHTGRPPGWLDLEHEEAAAADEREEAFLAAARHAWRNANAKAKRELLRDMKARAQ